MPPRDSCGHDLLQTVSAPRAVADPLRLGQWRRRGVENSGGHWWCRGSESGGGTEAPREAQPLAAPPPCKSRLRRRPSSLAPRSGLPALPAGLSPAGLTGTHWQSGRSQYGTRLEFENLLDLPRAPAHSVQGSPRHSRLGRAPPGCACCRSKSRSKSR